VYDLGHEEERKQNQGKKAIFRATISVCMRNRIISDEIRD
jgi:hypothetical protein